jgi:ribosome recycling factor
MSYIEPIEKAIAQSGLGMSCAVDKNVIRLNLPMLTEEYRLALGKTLNEKAEQAKQVIRRQREDVWNKIQAAQKAKEISEDDKFRGKDELQKVVDDYQEKIKNLVEKKKNELI